MATRHYREPRDDGGALVWPHRIPKLGAYELLPETRARARAFVMAHADYFRLTGDDIDVLFDMLGLIDDETSS